jgi:hypothetical protein
VSLAGDLLGLGLGVLRSVAGEATGTITQDGATTAFTSARITSRRRRPLRGNLDAQEVELELAASGITGVTPRPDALVTITGDDTLWLALKADPVAPGGTVIAWRLSLQTHVNRDLTL